MMSSQDRKAKDGIPPVEASCHNTYTKRFTEDNGEKIGKAERVMRNIIGIMSPVLFTSTSIHNTCGIFK
jgi:hypothetical protein